MAISQPSVCTAANAFLNLEQQMQFWIQDSNMSTTSNTLVYIGSTIKGLCLPALQELGPNIFRGRAFEV